MSVVKRLNRIISRCNARCYLEIGVEKGQTFKSITAAIKTGVDPNFKFDIHDLIDNEKVFLFKMTSDEYWRLLPQFQTEFYKDKVLFDIIYIDGLHTWPQAFKDFLNSLPYTHDRTIWIFDDTFPSDPYSAYPNIQKSIQFRKLAGLSGCPWHGDVFKIIFLLHDFYPFFSYATIIDNGNPQTVVWKTPRAALRKRILDNPGEIQSVGYFDLMSNYKILNPISDITLESYIESVYDDEIKNNSIDIDSIILNSFKLV